MSYVAKIIASDEELIGIARLHWIYVAKGVLYFFLLAGGGWLLNVGLQHVAVWMAATTTSPYLPVSLLNIGHGVMMFVMAGGFFIFTLFVIKILTTEVALSNRRVYEKTGLVFVKTHQIDLEEIRGENLDLGWFGRILGYGYLLLDCRFIGDIKLPAIENPERFLRALHDVRAKTQDSLSVVIGKGAPRPLKLEETNEQPETPKPAEPQPSPEQVPPEVPPQPVQPTPPPLKSMTVPTVDVATLAAVVKQVVPEVAREVTNELVREGVIAKPGTEGEGLEPGENADLAGEFDHVALRTAQGTGGGRPNPNGSVH